MFKRIGIIGKKDDPAVRNTLIPLIALLNERDVDVLVDERCAALEPAGVYRAMSETRIAEDRDLVITIGGDGTLLRAATLVFPQPVALLGINLGRLGFLTDLSPAQIGQDLAAILDGSYVREQRFVLGCAVVRTGHVVAESQGLNDIVVEKWNTTRLITFDTCVDGRFLHSQRSDGMIVATPTGSTAHALSAGGPILHPGLEAIVLVPICPHMLSNRPIVIGAPSVIEIKIGTERDDESRVTCDGNFVAELATGDVVRVSRHRQAVHLIHPANYDYFATLRAKLHWGRGPC